MHNANPEQKVDSLYLFSNVNKSPNNTAFWVNLEYNSKLA